MISPERTGRRELLSPKAVEFRGTTAWDPVEHEERSRRAELHVRHERNLEAALGKLTRKEKAMVKRFAKESVRIVDTTDKVDRKKASTSKIEGAIAKVSEHLQLMQELASCAEPGCKLKATAQRAVKAELRGLCEVHRQLRAIALSINIEADRSAAAKLFRSKPGVQCVDVTPALALALLESNVNNRGLNPDRVAMYARDMKNGDWRLNNQGIGLGADRILQDGQHRLWAVVKSEATVPMLVAVGLSEDVRPTIDQGRPRTVGDALQIFDGQPSGTRVHSWLKAIDTLHTMRPTPISHAVARRALWRYESSVEWFLANGPKAPYGRAAVVGALIYAHAVEPDHVEEFTRRYISGANLDEGSPILALRNYVAERISRRVDSVRTTSLKTLKCVLAASRSEALSRVVAAEDAFEHFRLLHAAASPESEEAKASRELSAA